MGYFDCDDNDEYDSFIEMQMTASSRQEAIDLTGDDTFYLGGDELDDEDDDNYWKNELIDTYGMDEDDLEDLDEDDCEELYDKLSGSSYKFSQNHSQRFSTSGSSTVNQMNTVINTRKSNEPQKKRWSFGTCIWIGIIVCFYLCVAVDGNMSPVLACIIVLIVAAVAYYLRNSK